MTHYLTWTLLAFLFFGAGHLSLWLQKFYVTWREDRHLDRCAGAFWALSLICYALAIHFLVEGWAR
jgi:hypothetical protein